MDTLEGLKQLDDSCIACVVTSPPYWGLRDYGLSGNIWDAKEGCEHKWEIELTDRPNQAGGTNSISGKDKSQPHAVDYDKRVSSSQFCSLCGAWKGQLGLEPTPDLYVKHLVDVFKEVHRVLKKDGTVWLNLGDSYNGGGGPGTYTDRKKPGVTKFNNPNKGYSGLKPKDLVGIPWRVAFALQQDGWWLRQDIIWAKPNPMPESVTDRCTKSHEYIFLLSKSQSYYYDADAIKEKQLSIFRSSDFIPSSKKDKLGVACSATKASMNNRSNEPINGFRNKRSVWTVTTKPFSGAHFATFPEDLIEPMIKAGSSEKGVCPDCGKPFIRQIDETKTIGWTSSCKCGKEPVPSLVLDPFMGAGTTALVARKLLRHYIGFELNLSYVKMANKRLKQIPERLECFDKP